MDVPLNGVSVIADDEACFGQYRYSVELIAVREHSHDGVEVVSDHGAQLLHSELKTSVTNEENGPTIAQFLRC